VKNIINGGADEYPDVHFLAIERPARLRPDAVSLFDPFISFIYLSFTQHATGDCLHIMAGAGVLEGWTHYIWHYVSKELGRGWRSRVNA